MARLKTKQIGDFASAVQSLIDNDSDQNAALIDAVEASVDSLETYADAISSDLAAEILATNGDVTAISVSIDSLEVLVATDADDADASIDSLETQVSGVASDLSDYEGDTDTSIDSLETALSSEISTTDGEITAINASINSLELYDLVFEQGGTVASTTQFTVNTAVKFGTNDDLLVFINGHNIHKNGSIEGAVEGYQTADGQTFELVSIGYDIDASDHVTVIGIRQ